MNMLILIMELILKYKKYTDDEMEAFYQIAYQNGIKNLIKE